MVNRKTATRQPSKKLHALVLLAAAAVHQPARSQPNSLSDLLRGIWVVDQHVGPQLDRHVTLCRSGSGWTVKTDLRAASLVDTTDGALRASFADGSIFRARVPFASAPPQGFWVQPPSPVLVSYATPVPLARLSGNCWQGNLSPLESRVRFSLVIYRRPDGALAADFIDPRWGARKGLTVMADWRGAILSDAKIRLTAIWDIRPVGLTAHWDKAANRLTVISDALPYPVTLIRSRAGGPGLASHEGAPASFTKSPVTRGDGWSTSTLAREGIDPQPIRQLVASIDTGSDLASAPNKIQALLIARNGKLVFEDYFFDFHAGELHDMRSAGKTIAPILLGAALGDRASSILDRKVDDVFASYRPLRNFDDRKKAMTVRDLMSMRSGYDCDDNNPNAPGNEERTQEQTATPDWYRYILDLPMASQPGGDRALYCSIDLHLSGGVARTLSGTWLPELFARTIAEPLQISQWAMNLTPTGDGYTGGGLYLSPRDQLKLGQLYLDGGLWNGHRVVSKDWVAESIRPYGTFRPVIPRDLNHRYGLGWHIHNLIVGGKNYPEFSAEGAGGQFVIVVPSLRLAVAIAGADFTSIQWYNWIFDIMQKYVIPAASPDRNSPPRRPS
jgi:CubicO group peptidase (beta-lactamase class C family)